MTEYAASGNEAFALRDVQVTFGGLVALSDVSLGVVPNQVLGVIGPNGAGKTTLFNVACGFVKPDTGTLYWRGQELSGLRPHRLAGLEIARTLQGLGLFGGISVLENVMVGAQRHSSTGFLADLFALPRARRDEQQLRDRAMATLEELRIAEYAGRLPDSLPYPIRKRVSLARALVSDPKLLLLDEPASGLSNDDIGELAETIRRLSDRMSIMLVEHHMDLVMQVCDQIVVLDFGRVIARGTPEDVRDDPAVLAAYLGEQADDSGRTKMEGADAQGS